MKFRLSLDTAAISLLAILTALFGLVLFLGAQVGVRITATLPEDGLIGPFQIIKLTFSEPVDPEFTESLFQFNLYWMDDRMG